MFVLVDRNKYDIRFFVNNNKLKETLLSIVIKNVYTYPTILNNNKGEKELSGNNNIFRLFPDLSKRRF